MCSVTKQHGLLRTDPAEKAEEFPKGYRNHKHLVSAPGVPRQVLVSWRLCISTDITHRVGHLREPTAGLGYASVFHSHLLC